MKNILITGAFKGLGLEISKRLLKDGFKVIGIGRTVSAEFTDLISNEAHALGDFRKFDLNDLDKIPELISGITKEHGALFGLVNNAALGVDGVLATLHQNDISKALRVNLEAPILMSKFACRSMLPRREGRIINISSIIASTGFNGLSVYGASKSGLDGFTRSLARELGRANITVNCVAPGFMATDMTSGLEGEKLDSIKRRAPLGLARTTDAAGAVSYLLSPDGQLITGTTITVDGGSTA
jgi:3-oxoacyl-[acyl-carrier protein] reductase